MTPDAARIPETTTQEPDRPNPRTTSLVDRALTLTAAANRLVAGERERTEAERVRRRVGEMERALEDLSGVVHLAQSLAALSGAPIDTSAATRGLPAFAEHAAGRPSDTVFNRARATITASTTAIREAVTKAWAKWAGQALRELPLHRVAVLPAEARDAVGEQERTLRALAQRSSVTVAQMQRFGEVRAALGGVLDSVVDPPVELRLLLERLEQGPVPLGDLDDREITLLRQVGDQIDVRRRRS